jgi:hypothetical protein
MNALSAAKPLFRALREPGTRWNLVHTTLDENPIKKLQYQLNSTNFASVGEFFFAPLMNRQRVAPGRRWVAGRFHYDEVTANCNVLNKMRVCPASAIVVDPQYIAFVVQ